MEEDECARMLDHLHQYVPHLEKLIAQLKDPKRKNRELQLNKLEGLHSMITDRKKKLKLDTLKKCEDVILKILHKVHPNIYKQFQPKPDSSQSSQSSCSMIRFLCKDPPESNKLMANVPKEIDEDNDYVRFQAARARLSEISTPASPSPPRDIPLVHKPIVIPTEQIKNLELNPDDFQITNWENTFDVKTQTGRRYRDHYKPEKPDVYSQAGESLSSPSKKIIFDRLGTRVDMSKPPLSVEDLELLTSPDREICFDEALPMEEKFSMNELQDLREVLQQRLQENENRANMPDLRNKLNSKEGTSKYKDKEKKAAATVTPVPPPPSLNSKPKSPRIEKIFKDPDSKFGNLLSSIDEKILGDTTVKKKDKKEQAKDEKHIRRDSKSSEKDSKKDGKKEHHTHDKKDRDSKEKKSHRDERKEHKDEKKEHKDHRDEKKEHRDEKKDHRDHKKDKSSSSSKDKESEKHKSGHSDKNKDKSKHHDRKEEVKASKHVERGKEHNSESKSELSTSNNNQTKSVNAGETSHNIESKEAPVYKRLADKYNPRPRKNSIETLDKTMMEDSRKLTDTGQKLSVIDHVFSFTLNTKDTSTINRNQPEIIRQNDPRQLSDPRQVNDQRQLSDPRQINDQRQLSDPRQINDQRQLSDPRQINDPRQNAVTWFEKPNISFESTSEKPNLLGRSPLLKMMPALQNNSVINNQFMSPPATPSSIKIGFPSTTSVIRQNELIPAQNQFIPPQQSMMNQNVSANRGGNTYMNTFILQNNLSSNISHTQFNNALTPTQNTFHAPVTPSKAFHPYDPIDVGEYDLSKMQPTDFYSPTFTKAKRPLLSPPPGFPNRGPQPLYSSRERTSYMGRQKNDPWISEGKNQWPERSHVREREETHRPVITSRDPRIRAREVKERNDKPSFTNTREPPGSVQSRRKSVDEHTFFASQNKYDSLYANMDRVKDKETFVSPLDSLYATGEERAQKTGKGYGVQKFRIPKRRNEKADRHNQNDEKDVKRDVHTKEILEEKLHNEEEEEEEMQKSKEVPPQKDGDVHGNIRNEVPLQGEIRSISETNREKNLVSEKERVTQKDEDTTIAPSTSQAKNNSEDIKATPSDESMLASFLTKLITKSEKKELLSAIFSTLTDTISDQQKKKFKRIQKIVDSDSDEEKEAEEKVEKSAKPDKSETSKEKAETIEADKQPEEEIKPDEDPKAKAKDTLKKDVKQVDEISEDTTNKSDNEDEDEVQEEIVEPQKVTVKKGRGKRRRPLKKIPNKNQVMRAKKMKRNRRRGKKVNNKKAPLASPTKSDDSVIETVGERIKNRRRNIKTPEPPKLRKCRTELDMLHDDIKEMFIRDGVLTATGKRMCRMLKPDAETESSSTKSLKTRSNSSLDDESTTTLDSPKRRARASNPKVIIEKADLSKLVTKPADESESESESVGSRLMKRSRNRLGSRRNVRDSSSNTSDLSSSPIRRKRNVKSKPNYTEDTDEEVPPQLSEPEEATTENTDKIETAEPPSEPPSVPKEATLTKKGGKKKKRGQNWASGIIIKKGKKKVGSNPVTPTPSLDGDRHSTVSDMDEAPEDSSFQDDNDSEIEFIEPDVNYYFDPQDKAVCKICQFKGKMIVQHYKTVHPKHEVLISRISPDNARKAVDESVEKGYDEVQVPEVPEAKIRRKKHTYQCRFCQVFFKNENSELFFDHLTSHTGEYRFICSFCPFKTANSKSLRSHFHTSHSASYEKVGSITPLYAAPPDFHLVFGYMCGECNFIQMDKSTVETHVKIYHLGDNQKIYKINMSMIEVKPSLLQTTECSAKELTETNEEKEKQEEEVGAAEEEQKDQGQKAKEQEAPPIVAEKTPEVSTEPDKTPAQPIISNKVADTPNPPEVKPIKEDPTVFKYNGDYVQENMILEEQKHEKMKEIHLTVVPKKKFTSNLLDRIKSRLDDKIDKISEAADSNEKTSENPFIFEEIITLQMDSPNDPTVKTLKKSVSVENAEGKKLTRPETKTTSETGMEKPINNKNSVPITNIIERLQGKLNVDSIQPPPLIPLNEFNINFIKPETEDIVIQVGPVAARKKNSYILYICYMQSCMFSSTNHSEFQVHCTTLHSNEGWDGFCNICNSKIGSFEVVNAFRHLISVHKNELNLESNSLNETEEAQNLKKPYLRMRRLSGDKLSEMRSESSQSESNESQTTTDENNEAFPFKIVDVVTQSGVEEEKVKEEAHNFPFQITNVISLADDDEEASNAPTSLDVQTQNNADSVLPSLTIISGTSSGSLTTVSAPITTATTSIAFQLPLQSTSGAGYSLVLPMLTPVNKSLIPVGKLSPNKVPSQTRSPAKPTISPTSKNYSNIKPPPLKVPSKKIMLKDTPLHPEEMVKPRKTQTALNSLLTEHKLVNLYKCPERNCTFSTDSKKPFEAHLNQHTELKPGMQVPCLYCNFKTDLEFFAVHCDIRHGRCQFCCPYCFYRAINQSYVEIHQEREHSGKPRRVLMVALNQDALMSQAHIQMPPLHTIIPLYVCGQLGCESKFIFPDNFKEHLSTVHKGIPLLCSGCQWCPTSPDNAVTHMQTHSIYYYHCRYCPFGGTSADEIYKHLANQHFALSPKIVLRQFVRDGSGKSSSEFSYKDAESYKRMKMISDENFKYITPSARFDVLPDKLKRPVKNLPVTATLSPICSTMTYISPKTTTELNKNELTTLFKALPKNPNVTLKIVEQRPVNSVKNAATEQNKNDVRKENDDKDTDSDVEIVSDDEAPISSLVKPVNSVQPISKSLANSVRPQSPIVLNKFLSSPSELLTLTQTSKSTTSREESKSVTVTAKEAKLDPKNTPDFVVIQPVSDNTLDEPLVDMRVEISKSAADDIDPLQLESEACTTIAEENSGDVPTEHTFTEAKFDVVNNFGFAEDGAVQEFSDLTAEEASFTADETMKKQGLMGRDLFRCGFCRAGFETSSLFKAHVTKCVEINKNGVPRPFKCAHCIKAFKSMGSLSDHVRLHGTLRFSCSLCDFKHQHQTYVRSHLKTKHKITSVILMPVDPNKRSLDEDEFVVRPKIHRQRSLDGISGNRDSTGNSTIDEIVMSRPLKASYGPDEIAYVPIREIFSREIKCSACGYPTKVRANLIRHLQLHTTGKEIALPITAPVNPVPCLEKNEKMFDKMTNLSLSSYNDAIRMASKVERKEKTGLTKEEEAQLPGFVPINKRYVCGGSCCHYLCLEESMLRCHLLALHNNESFYKCVHCEEQLSSEKGVINVEFIIKHLRLHDLHLYKCRYCKFLHHLKHKVDRHVLEKHSDKPPIVIIVRELEQEPEEPQEHEEVKEMKEAKPWRCGMCKYRCTNKNEIASHVFNKHGVVSQFKCALCQFTSPKKSVFPAHFENDHPGQNIDVIDLFYEVEETPIAAKGATEGTFFDTTPIWQRDKSKFKHIRGIPLDETKFPKKSPIKVPLSSDNLDKAIEAVASGVANVTEKDILKSPLSKKPKTLKEKKLEIKTSFENEVIQIDDEEGKNRIGRVIMVSKNLFGRRMSDVPKPTATVVKEEQPEGKIVELTRGKSIPELITKTTTQPVASEKEGDISLKEIQEMDLATLKTIDLSGTYGPFGKPINKQFLCPLCSTFKTKKVEDITHHLYKELHYFRYVCTNCALTGITYNFLHKHSQKKHLTESIHPLSPNPRIEEWVQKLLAIQRRIMADNDAVTAVSTIPVSTTVRNDAKAKEPESTVSSKSEVKISQGVTVEKPKAVVSDNLKFIMVAKEINLPDSSSSLDTESVVSKGRQTPLIHQCQYCSYSCKAASDLRKHERRHWVQKPLKCGYCDVEGVTKYEVLQHAKRAHPTLEPLVVPVPMPSTPTIKPITRKRKYPKPSLENSNSSEETTPLKNLVVEAPESTKDDEEAESELEDFVFICSQCSMPFDSLQEVKLHWDSTHKTKLSLFKFKKILRRLFEEPIETGEEDVDVETEDPVIFVCNFCPKRCTTESETRLHWETTHKVKQPDFKFKKLMRSQLLKKGSLNYKCCYCDFIGHLEVVKKHFVMKHPNMSFSVFRYKCGYCKQYLKNIDKAKIHCKQMHNDAEPSYLNIKDAAEESKEPEKPKDFVCEYCSIEFEVRKELVDHHKALHSHLELNLPPDLTAQPCLQQEEGDDMKMYMCPQCQHKSNSYAAMRDHLRNHAKPYQCCYCPLRFTYPSLVKSHHQKDHADSEYKYTTIDEANKLNENLRKNLLVLTKDGSYEKISQSKGVKRLKADQGNQARKIRIVDGGFEPEDSLIITNSTTTITNPKCKNTARKSTTQGVKRTIDEGFSYYGKKPDMSGLDNVRTVVSFMESMVTMNVAQFRDFIDIAPTVPVVDIVKYRDEL